MDSFPTTSPEIVTSFGPVRQIVTSWLLPIWINHGHSTCHFIILLWIPVRNENSNCLVVWKRMQKYFLNSKLNNYYLDAGTVVQNTKATRRTNGTYRRANDREDLQTFSCRCHYTIKCFPASRQARVYAFEYRSKWFSDMSIGKCSRIVEWQPYIRLWILSKPEPSNYSL